MYKLKRGSNKAHYNYVDYNYVIYFCKFYRGLYFYEFINIFERNSLKTLYFFRDIWYNINTLCKLCYSYIILRKIRIWIGELCNGKTN